MPPSRDDSARPRRAHSARSKGQTASTSTAEPDRAPYADAVEQVRLASSRLALLHLCFARTLVEELGDRRGRELTAKAIKRYGTEIGKKVRAGVVEQGLSLDPANYGAGPAKDLPAYGLHDRIEHLEVGGEERIRAHGCLLAKVWHEYDGDALGRLYCYVDPAKYMAFNPDHKLVHLKCVPDGDAFCEFKLCRTTDHDRRLFDSNDPDWITIDKP